MNNFWQWMHRKGYYSHNAVSGCDTYYEPMYRYNNPTKQMLIGYMTEYLIEEDEGVAYNIHTNIEDLYNWLLKKIEEKNYE